MQSQVAIAKSLDQPGAVINELEKLGIGGMEGVEGSIATPFSADRLTNHHGFLRECGGIVGGRHRRQIPFIGGTGQLGTAVQIGYPTPQRVPGLGSIGPRFRGAKDA